MRTVLCCLLSAVGLMGQGAGEDQALRNLTSTLTGIGKGDASRARMSERLVDDVLALANRNHEPSRNVVTGFAEELTAALFGKELSAQSITTLRQSIRDVLRRSSATFPSAASLRQVLARAGVDSTKAQLITRRFMAIGEEIRGPDDIGGQKFIDRPPQK